MILVNFTNGISAPYNKLALPSFWIDNALKVTDIQNVEYTSKQDEVTVKEYVKALRLDIPVVKVSADRGKEPVNAESKRALFNNDAECGKQLDNIKTIVDFLNENLDASKSPVRIHVYFSYK